MGSAGVYIVTAATYIHYPDIRAHCYVLSVLIGRLCTQQIRCLRASLFIIPRHSDAVLEQVPTCDLLVTVILYIFSNLAQSDFLHSTESNVV